MGGRYDDLVEYCGGKPTPAVGVALGAERILQAMDKSGFAGARQGVFIACAGGEAEEVALGLARELRTRGVAAESELTGRSLKGQLKLANRKGYPKVIIIGTQELEQGVLTLRDMVGGTQQIYSRQELLQGADSLLGGKTMNGPNPGCYPENV